MPGKLLKLLKKIRRKPHKNPNFIDDIDVKDLRFRGVNREGTQIVKKGIEGEVSKSWLQGLKDAKAAKNKKLKNKKFGGAIGPNGIL